MHIDRDRLAVGQDQCEAVAFAFQFAFHADCHPGDEQQAGDALAWGVGHLDALELPQLRNGGGGLEAGGQRSAEEVGAQPAQIVAAETGGLLALASSRVENAFAGSVQVELSTKSRSKTL